MSDYYLVFLTSGQQPPPGSTGIALANGGILCLLDGEMPSPALLGHKLPTDPEFSNTYNYRLATEEEIAEYEDMFTTVSGIE